MDIACYILAGLSVLFGVVTAVLYYVNKPRQAFVTKMVASTLFIATGIAALSETYVDKTAATLIVIAMLPSFWGDFFLARKEMSKIASTDNFAYGVYSFAVSQVLFSIGFLMLANFDFEWLFLLLLLLGAGAPVLGKITKMFSFKGKEFPLALLYGVLLCLTLAVTASGYYLDGSTTSLIAMLGAISFVISDFALGMYYFSSFKCKKIFNFFIMIFYFLAEVLYAIALIA